MNKNVKKIIKIAAITTLILTLIMSIICMVNYYRYVGVINKLTSGEINWLTRFELQESRDSRLYAALSSLIWTAYISIVTIIINIANFIVGLEPKKIKKIR